MTYTPVTKGFALYNDISKLVRFVMDEDGQCYVQQKCGDQWQEEPIARATPYEQALCHMLMTKDDPEKTMNVMQDEV